MCGIVGYASTTTPIDRKQFDYMRDTMIHRGPDGMASAFLEEDRLALGHRRLSIIDLSERSAQPMASEDGQFWITFNGEIYNYKSLKAELESKYTFRSTGDTEVLLHGYQEWGIEGLLKRVNGMFAFGIADLHKRRLVIARDRIGIKPLYYSHVDDRLIFASEIKAITAHRHVSRKLSKHGLASYFRYRYIIGPYSIYDDIQKLMPGHYMEYDLDRGNLSSTPYWSLEQSLNDSSKPEEALIEDISQRFDEAVKKRAIAADVAVHTFLSGGIDSSMVTAVLKKYAPKMAAYTIEVVDEQKNELEDARRTAERLEIELKASRIDAKVFQDSHNEVIAAYDEPLADTSNIPTYFLCKLAGEHVKVALSGDGGDELFYGYNWHAQFVNTDGSKTLNDYVAMAYRTFDANTIQQLFNLDQAVDEVEAQFGSYVAHVGISEENVHRLDFHTFMVDDILTKVDIASMAHSLEVRVPFLDHELVELAYSIPAEQHHKHDELKYLLKKAAESLLPKETIYKKKKGFSVPSIRWIDVNYEHNILNGYASMDGIWNTKFLAELLKEKLHEEQRWLLYNFERWYAIHFHGKMEPKPYTFLDRVKRKLSR